jgi:hypothetical protein
VKKEDMLQLDTQGSKEPLSIWNGLPLTMVVKGLGIGFII